MLDANIMALVGAVLGALCGFVVPFASTLALWHERDCEQSHFARMASVYKEYLEFYGTAPKSDGEGDAPTLAFWAADVQEAAAFGELTSSELSTLTSLGIAHLNKPADPMRFEFHPSIMFRGLVAVGLAAFGTLTFYFLPSDAADKMFLLLFASMAVLCVCTDMKARIIPLWATVSIVIIALLHQLVVHGVMGALCALGVAMLVTGLAWGLARLLERMGRPSPVGGGDLLYLFGVACACGCSGILIGATVSAICGSIPCAIGFMMHKVTRDTYIPMAIWLGVWMISGCIGAQLM